jgi:hypothetical protein
MPELLVCRVPNRAIRSLTILMVYCALATRCPAKFGIVEIPLAGKVVSSILSQFEAVALYLTWRLGWFTALNLETVMQQMRHLTWRLMQEGTAASSSVFWHLVDRVRIDDARNSPNNLPDYFSTLSTAVSRLTTASLG